MHFLYVDDDMVMTRSADLMIRKAGHTCDTTYLGERAVQLANMKRYDAIILDIMLPDIDGYEVIERLREAQNSTPLMIQTGLVDRAEPGDAEAFGVDDILIKPYSMTELIGKLEQLTARSAETETAPTGQSKPADTAPKDESSRKRRGMRMKVAEACELHFGGEKASGMVLSISKRGAAIRLPQHLTQCPKHFILKFLTGQCFQCRVCWRVGDKVGIAFV